MYVCMSVHNGFTIEIYIVYVPFGTCCSGCHCAMTWRSRLRTRWKTTPERVQMYGRRLTAQQKDERRQDNGDEKRLARHHPSNLLRSLTRERIGGGQHGIVSPVLRTWPFRTFHVLRVRHLMHMRIPSISCT